MILYPWLLMLLIEEFIIYLLCESNEWFDGVRIYSLDFAFWMDKVQYVLTIRVRDVVMYICVNNLEMSILGETLLEFQ